MAARHLINEDGKPFSAEELDRLTIELDALGLEDRAKYRDENAGAVARHGAERMLIVAGPGTSKSTIFKQRILSWLEASPDARVLALSFVRKLVADLNSDIQNDTGLSDEQKRRCDVHTLHKHARSIVEQNHGTKEWSFAPHFRIIGQDWKATVWKDVLSLAGQTDAKQYSWQAFEKQVHDDSFESSSKWKQLKETYFILCRFYNAAGFCDLVLRARDALGENPELNLHHYFIVDEYQDFNASEEHLLNEITENARGALIVGDDDQVLYEKLKSGKASLIREIYADKSVLKAMLAFCGRCDFHITRTASHFIKKQADPESIKKIYLPMKDAASSKKVQIVACPTATTAVDYVRRFVEEHEDALEQRKKELELGQKKDAYLLILSPSGSLGFYKPNGAKDQLLELLEPYADKQRQFSEDYYKVLSYYSLANYPSNNFTFRKVLHYETILDEELLPLLQMGTLESRSFASMPGWRMKNALARVEKVKDIIESKIAVDEKVRLIDGCIGVADHEGLRDDLEQHKIGKEQVDAIEHQEEEATERDELEIKRMAAIELITIAGSKGLSADHVMIIGFDNINMSWITSNAFFVAMTRARKSLHIVTALKAGGATRAHGYLDDLPDGHIEFTKYTKGKRVVEPLGNRRNFVEHLRRLNSHRR